MRRLAHNLRQRLCTLVLGATVAACGSSGDASVSEAPQATSVAQAPDDATAEALEELHLTAAQRHEIEQLRKQLEAEFAAAYEARDAFVTELQTQLRRGDLDATRLEAKRIVLVEAIERGKPELIEAANSLHELLTPEQRQALLDEVESRSSGGPDRGALAKELDLSWGQKRELFARTRQSSSFDRSEREALRRQLREAKDAFASDDFDAARLEIARGPLVDMWTGRAVEAVVLFTPVLEPGQRAALADRIDRQL
jgi:Spy/CpxP family protein refolding chaperone